MYRIAPYKTRRNEVSTLFTLFDNMMSDFPGEVTTNANFKVDIHDSESKFVFEAELPGITKENVSVDYKDEKLIISVDNKMETEEEGKNFIRRERKFTSMKRAFLLKNIDSKAISAKLNNGILTIDVPKSVEEDNSFKIDVQ